MTPESIKARMPRFTEVTDNLKAIKGETYTAMVENIAILTRGSETAMNTARTPMIATRLGLGLGIAIASTVKLTCSHHGWDITEFMDNVLALMAAGDADAQENAAKRGDQGESPNSGHIE